MVSNWLLKKTNIVVEAKVWCTFLTANNTFFIRCTIPAKTPSEWNRAFIFAHFICQVVNYVQSEDGYFREETQAFLTDISVGLTVFVDQQFPWYQHVFMCV